MKYHKFSEVHYEKEINQKYQVYLQEVENSETWKQNFFKGSNYLNELMHNQIEKRVKIKSLREQLTKLLQSRKEEEDRFIREDDFFQTYHSEQELSDRLTEIKLKKKETEEQMLMQTMRKEELLNRFNNYTLELDKLKTQKNNNQELLKLQSGISQKITKQQRELTKVNGYLKSENYRFTEIVEGEKQDLKKILHEKMHRLNQQKNKTNKMIQEYFHIQEDIEEGQFQVHDQKEELEDLIYQEEILTKRKEESQKINGVLDDFKEILGQEYSEELSIEQQSVMIVKKYQNIMMKNQTLETTAQNLNLSCYNHNKTLSQLVRQLEELMKPQSAVDNNKINFSQQTLKYLELLKKMDSFLLKIYFVLNQQQFRFLSLFLRIFKYKCGNEEKQLLPSIIQQVEFFRKIGNQLISNQDSTMEPNQCIKNDLIIKNFGKRDFIRDYEDGVNNTSEQEIKDEYLIKLKEQCYSTYREAVQMILKNKAFFLNEVNLEITVINKKLKQGDQRKKQIFEKFNNINRKSSQKAFIRSNNLKCKEYEVYAGIEQDQDRSNNLLTIIFEAVYSHKKGLDLFPEFDYNLAKEFNYVNTQRKDNKNIRKPSLPVIISTPQSTLYDPSKQAKNTMDIKKQILQQQKQFKQNRNATVFASRRQTQQVYKKVQKMKETCQSFKSIRKSIKRNNIQSIQSYMNIPIESKETDKEENTDSNFMKRSVIQSKVLRTQSQQQITNAARSQNTQSSFGTEREIKVKFQDKFVQEFNSFKCHMNEESNYLQTPVLSSVKKKHSIFKNTSTQKISETKSTCKRNPKKQTSKIYKQQKQEYLQYRDSKSFDKRSKSFIKGINNLNSNTFRLSKISFKD